MSYYAPDCKLEPVDIPTICFCDVCNGDLYEGDEVYRVDGDTICSDDCLSRYFKHVKMRVRKGRF